MQRRDFLRGLVAMPSIIVIDRLMPVKPFRWVSPGVIVKEIDYSPVVAGTRRLSAEWSIETVQETEHWYGEEAAAEIAKEVDKWAAEDLTKRPDTSSQPRTPWSRRPSGLITRTA